MRLETYDAQGARQDRREWTRIDANTVQLQRWDATGALVETRNATPTELARFQAWEEDGREQQIRTNADAAIDGNRTFLALASPTNAQNAAQVKALTRQVNGVLRMMLRRLDATD